MAHTAIQTADSVVDRIYAAALEPAAWSSAMHGMQRLFGGRACGIYVSDMQRRKARLIHVRGLDAGYLRTYEDHFLCNNPWANVAQLQGPGVIRTDHSLDEYFNEPGYYRRTALFNEWMKPQQFIHTLGTNLHVDARTRVKCFVYRNARGGAFDANQLLLFERLGRHLINAVRVARRLASEDAESDKLADMADQLSFGVVLVDDQARVLQANRFARKLLRERDGLQASRGLLVASHTGDRSALTQLVHDALAVHRAQSLDAPRRVNLRRKTRRRPVCVAAVPLPRRSDNPFAERHAALALILTDPDSASDVCGELMKQRFGLTPAEIRLAYSLARGLTLRDAAEESGLTYETARSYLKGIFHKTGTSRQAELLRTLMMQCGATGPSS